MNKPFTVIKIIQETSNVRTLQFKLNEPLEFKPGQFIMIGKDLNIKGETKKIKRAFSISSQPSDKDYVEITVKKEDKGLFTPVIFEQKENDSLEVSGPFGQFIYKDNLLNDYENIFLIAGGTGIAPLRSMYNHILTNKIKLNISLLYSTKTPEQIIYRKELETLKEAHENFKPTVTITKPEESKEPWDKKKGRISKDLINENLNNLEKTVFFICGPPEMVESTVTFLKELNATNEQIKVEKW